MKLATRIIAVSLMTVVLMTVVASYFTVRIAWQEFENQQHDMATRVASTMSAVLVDAWRAEGLGGIQRILRQGGPASHLDLEVRWVWFERAAPPSERPNLPAEDWPSSREIVSAIATSQSGQRMMHTYVPLTLASDRHGGLEFTGSLAPLERQTRRAIWLGLVTIGSFALVSVFVAWATGVAWIARPLQLLMARTQQISQGDFGKPLELSRRDELGELAVAFNEMCDRLAAQQAAIEAEMTRRMETQEQLWHADRLASVGQLAAGIAHELGTPLNVISGRASLISRTPEVPDDVRAGAQVIKAEAERITGIVRQLLDFARRGTPRRVATNLQELAARTAGLLTQLAEKNRVTIEVLPAANAIVVPADPPRIQQVLTNLYMNAIEAMPNGGTVRVEVTQALPQGADHSRPPSACISVVDEGVGIAPGDLDHVFEPFFTTRDTGEGTGLGLSIAWGIVQEHGGRIDVSSEPGHGTRFDVYLPAEDQP